jgi:hypothetical protein
LLESTLQMTFRELANRPVLLIVLPEANVTITLCAHSTPGVIFFFFLKLGVFKPCKQ